MLRISRLIIVLCAGTLLLPLACSSSSDGDDNLKPVKVQLDGSVEKGPFVLGSSITIAPVDAEGNPSGQQFTTQTINDLGEFSVNFEAAGFVSLEGSGFYYNEVTGDLSGANLTLRAFYEIRSEGAQNAHLNLLTHLTYSRVKNLVQAGKDLAAAIEQAEAELVAALPIGPTNLTLDDPAIELTLQGGDTLANAYLFAVSSVLSHAARLRSPGSPDAALQELINGISADLASDGEISHSTVVSLVEAQQLPRELANGDAANYLIPDSIKADLASRFDELGSSAAVPDLNRVLDSDFDSVANADDNCWWIANDDQADSNDDGVGDACDFVFNDSETGLSWQNPSRYLPDHTPQSASGSLQNNMAYCDDLDWGGFSDWRLPSIDALRTLVDDCPTQAFGGSCTLHNNGCPTANCRPDCPSCSKSGGPYWKNGLIGPTAAPSRTQGFGMEFMSAEIAQSVNADHLRCVRGHMNGYELVCADNVDDDGNGNTDCADLACFAQVGEAGACTGLDVLGAIASLDFWATCFNRTTSNTCNETVGSGCMECYSNCVQQFCNQDCQEEGPNVRPECITCAQNNCSQPEACFGTFVCEPEFFCTDGKDNDSDGLTDFDDPDCTYLTEGLPDTDGDVDGDVDGDTDGDLPTVSPVVEGRSATFYYIESEEVSKPIKIVGDFQASPWNPSTGIIMQQIGGNLFSATVNNLDCGQQVYKFWYPENNWITDPLNPNEDGTDEHCSVFSITDGCSTDGDVDGDSDTLNCVGECASFAGIYCTETVQAGEGACADYFLDSNQIIEVLVANAETCTFTVRTATGEPIILMNDVHSCEFSGESISALPVEDGSCQLSSNPVNGTLTVSCKGGSCLVDLTQEACSE